MTTKKTGDPRDRETPPEGARFVPVTGTYGTEVIVPGPLTPGKPKPEPEGERWTLGPGRHEERPSEGDGRPDDAPSAGPNPPTTPRRPG